MPFAGGGEQSSLDCLLLLMLAYWTLLDDVRVIVTPLLLPVVVRHVGVSVSCHAAGTCSGPRGSGLPDR